MKAKDIFTKDLISLYAMCLVFIAGLVIIGSNLTQGQMAVLMILCVGLEIAIVSRYIKR